MAAAAIIAVSVAGLRPTAALELDAGPPSITQDPATSPSPHSVVIAHDRDAAMFSFPSLAPGDRVQSCINVTYSGSLTPAEVSLYGVVSGTGLDDYLDLVVEVGHGGAGPECERFTPMATVFSGTLAGFGVRHSDFADGLRAWTPATSPEVRSYRFTVTLQDDNRAQGKSASATFSWEAQNR